MSLDLMERQTGCLQSSIFYHDLHVQSIRAFAIRINDAFRGHH